MEIRWLHEDEFMCILPFMKILHPDVDEEKLTARMKEMFAPNYRCASVWIDNMLIAISGIWELNKHYSGKHWEPDHVLVLPEYRNRNIGLQLMQWIEQEAIQNGCRAMELNCYIENNKGRKFWEGLGYKALGIHYYKRIK